mmetsp:Transcript_15321/g.42724  ORF Transcript_15321/g.42724 Transcript_15321/m.42724 type:complete len:226 (-) Transcript_15321:4326-5003(-)
MIFLKVKWMRSKRFASSGSCRRISSEPMKIASRYIHLDCTFIHTSITSEMVDMARSHLVVSKVKGATNLEDIIEERFMVWSSSVCEISSVERSTKPRSCVPLKYLTTENSMAFHVFAISLMPRSMLSSFTAPDTISLISGSKRSRFISKSCPKENLRGSISNCTPVLSIRVVQWRGRSASFFSRPISGRDWVKPVTTSSTLRNGRSSFCARGIRRKRPSNSSMPR